MSTAIYAVGGLKCELGMARLMENIRSLSGVTGVAMDLITGGQSPLMIMSGNKLGADAVRAVVENAGFGLVPPRGPGVGGAEDDSSTLFGAAHAGSERMMFSMGGARS
jgi:copper chaperone